MHRRFANDGTDHVRKSEIERIRGKLRLQKSQETEEIKWQKAQEIERIRAQKLKVVKKLARSLHNLSSRISHRMSYRTTTSKRSSTFSMRFSMRSSTASKRVSMNESSKSSTTSKRVSIEEQSSDHHSHSSRRTTRNSQRSSKGLGVWMRTYMWSDRESHHNDQIEVQL